MTSQPAQQAEQTRVPGALPQPPAPQQPQGRQAPAQPPAPGNGGAPARPMMPPQKIRRRPMLWAVGIALIALGGLGAAYVATAVSNTQKVIVLRHNVDRGALITAADLTTASVNRDPSLAPMKASDAAAIAGKWYATRDLNAGSLLTRKSIAEKIAPAAGQKVVPLYLHAAQLPADGLRQGDNITVVATTGSAGSQSGGTGGTVTKGGGQGLSVNAEVWDIVVNKTDGSAVVDVTVATSDAAALADLNSTGNFGLVVRGAQ